MKAVLRGIFRNKKTGRELETLCVSLGELHLAGQELSRDGYKNKVHLEPQEATLLRSLMYAFPRVINTTEMLELMWPDPDKEPEWPENCLKVRIHRANQKLRRNLGVAIFTPLYGWGMTISFTAEHTWSTRKKQVASHGI